jgi:ribosomal protein L11 methyltransferase
VSGAPSFIRFTLHCRPGTADETGRLLLRLPTPGWQESISGEGFVFWLTPAALDDPVAGATLEALRELGTLEAAPEAADWEAAWRRFHRPVRIGRILVRPVWAPADPEALDVLVDVGMAFGTGGHQTTRQCLRLLQEIAPGSLLDVGCGTGVLSVAAARLGFGPVYAIDNDELAISATAANALLNDVRLDIALADATDPAVPLPPVDVLVGNVALQPLVALGRRVCGAGNDRALPRDVILAGLLATQLEEAVAAWRGYVIAGRLDDGEWSAAHLLLEDRPAPAGGRS